MKIRYLGTFYFVSPVHSSRRLHVEMSQNLSKPTIDSRRSEGASLLSWQRVVARALGDAATEQAGRRPARGAAAERGRGERASDVARATAIAKRVNLDVSFHRVRMSIGNFGGSGRGPGLAKFAESEWLARLPRQVISRRGRHYDQQQLV